MACGLVSHIVGKEENRQIPVLLAINRNQIFYVTPPPPQKKQKNKTFSCIIEKENFMPFFDKK